MSCAVRNGFGTSVAASVLYALAAVALAYLRDVPLLCVAMSHGAA
jgi:hypothetical protein